MREFMAHTSGMLSMLQVHFARLVAATAPQPQPPAPDPAAALAPNLGLTASPSTHPSPMPSSTRVTASDQLASSGMVGSDSESIVPASPGDPIPGGAGSERAPEEPGSPDAAHAAAAEALAGAARPRSAAAGQPGALLGPSQGLQAPEQPRVGPRPAPYGGTPTTRSSNGQQARPALLRIQAKSGGSFAASGTAGLTKNHLEERRHVPRKACGVGLPTEARGAGDRQPVHEAAPAGGPMTGATTPAECWHRRCESGPALRSAVHGQRPKPPAAAGRQAALARGAPAALPWGGGPAEAEAGEHVWPCDALC